MPYLARVSTGARVGPATAPRHGLMPPLGQPKVSINEEDLTEDNPSTESSNEAAERGSQKMRRSSVSQRRGSVLQRRGSMRRGSATRASLADMLKRATQSEAVSTTRKTSLLKVASAYDPSLAREGAGARLAAAVRAHTEADQRQPAAEQVGAPATSPRRGRKARQTSVNYADDATQQALVAEAVAHAAGHSAADGAEAAATARNASTKPRRASLFRRRMSAVIAAYDDDGADGSKHALFPSILSGRPQQASSSAPTSSRRMSIGSTLRSVLTDPKNFDRVMDAFRRIDQNDSARRRPGSFRAP